VTLVLHVDGRPSALPDVVRELMFPAGHSALAGRVSAEGPSRTGLLAKGGDGQVYRILRDLAAGRSTAMTVEGQATTPITDDPGQIEALSADVFGVPNRDIFDSLFLLRDDELPSRTGGGVGLDNVGSGLGGGELPPGFGTDTGQPAMSEDDRDRRIAEIEELMKKAEEVAQVQFDLDGMQREVFELDDRLKPVHERRALVKNTVAELEPMAHLGELPTDIADVAEAARKLRTGLRKEIERAGDEITDLRSEMEQEIARARSPVQMIKASFQDPLVKYGMIGGGVALLLGTLGFFVNERMRILALLDIPAFAVAVVGAFRFLNEAEVISGLKRRIKRLQSSRDEAKIKIDESSLSSQNLLAQHGLNEEDLEHLGPQLERYYEAKERADTARREADELANAPETQQMLARREELEGKIKQVEDDLYTMGAGIPDMGQLQFELEELHRMGGDPGGAALTGGAGGSGGGLGLALDAASGVLGVSTREIFETVRPRVAQYLSGLSDRRYGEVRLESGLVVYESTSAQLLPFDSLPPGDKDLVYLAIKLTLIEHVVSQRPRPVFLDGAFATFPQGKTPLVVRMLQFLGSKTQVVCITRNEGLQSAATTRVQL
jgi:hypothetical protein